MAKINFQKDRNFNLGFGLNKCKSNIESIFKIDFPLNFFNFEHNNAKKSLKFMELHQNNPKTKAKTLIVVDVFDYEFLFGRALHQLYDDVIILDNHESLYEYLEDEVLQDMLLESDDINPQRASKVTMMPSSTTTTQYLYTLF
jgi:hypothetical protein